MILAAVSEPTFLGIPALAWFLFFFAIATVAVAIVLAGVFWVVFHTPAGLEQRPVRAEPETLEDLDDWLAAEGPLEEFKHCKRPEASVSIGGIE